MQTLTLDAPALFGDHHVSEARRILLELPGIKEVYASSGFQVIEVTFDPKKITEKQITECLTEAGYLGTLPMKIENDPASKNELGGGAYRSTAYYETIKKTVSFSQRVNYQGRPLWPCPGLGPIKEEEG
jgi:copper chaperone CopZ